MDEELILAKNDASDALLALPELDNGYHTLKVLAKDDLENTATRTVELNIVSSQAVTPVFNWLSPSDGSAIKFPAAFKASLANGQRIKKIDFYFQKKGGIEQFLTSLIPNGNISFSWSNKPDPGEYTVYGNMFDAKNKKYVTDKINVMVK